MTDERLAAALKAVEGQSPPGLYGAALRLAMAAQELDVDFTYESHATGNRWCSECEHDADAHADTCTVGILHVALSEFINLLPTSKEEGQA